MFQHLCVQVIRQDETGSIAGACIYAGLHTSTKLPVHCKVGLENLHENMPTLTPHRHAPCDLRSTIQLPEGDS